jgi:hypothetical protein
MYHPRLICFSNSPRIPAAGSSSKRMQRSSAVARWTPSRSFAGWDVSRRGPPSYGAIALNLLGGVRRATALSRSIFSAGSAELRRCRTQSSRRGPPSYGAVALNTAARLCTFGHSKMTDRKVRGPVDGHE